MDSKLQRLIKRIEASVPNQQDVSAAMERQLGRMRIRTLAGRDVNGFPFQRKKDGSPSTLNRTGTLLRSLQASANQGEQGLEGRIAVTGRAREYAPYVNAKRRFLGTSDSEKHDMVDDVRESIKDRRNQA